MDDLIDRLRNCLDENPDGDIYVLGEVIAKRYSSRDDAEYVFDIGSYAYQHKIQVPEVIALHNLDISSRVSRLLRLKPIKDWFLFMQRIEGKHINSLEGMDYSEALNQLKKQIEKLFDLRIHPIDATFNGNSIFNPKERKLYLIDFDAWEKVPKGEEVDRSIVLRTCS